jgi:hypothetical protein
LIDLAEVTAKVLDSAIKDYEGRGGPPSMVIDVVPADARNIFDAPLSVGTPRAHHDHPTPVTRWKLEDFPSPASYSPFAGSIVASFGGSPATSLLLPVVGFSPAPAASVGGGAPSCFHISCHSFGTSWSPPTTPATCQRS